MTSSDMQDTPAGRRAARADGPRSSRPKRRTFTAAYKLAMIEKYGLTGKLCHYSVGEGLPLIRAAKARGLAVTVLGMIPPSRTKSTRPAISRA